MDPKTKIKISRKGASIGEFELWEIFDKVKSLVILPTDHYWYAGMAEWKLVSEIIPLAREAEEDYLASENSKPINPPATPPPRETSQKYGFKCLTCSLTFQQPQRFDGNSEWDKLIKDSITFYITAFCIAIGGSIGIFTLVYITGRLARETSNGSTVTILLFGLLVLVLGIAIIYYTVFYTLKCFAALIAAGVVRGTHPVLENKCPHCSSHTILRTK
jgi:DNA-directed RNA polymerase subunit RPC12/RpoP